MTKTKEELQQLKTEYETLTNKLKELTEEEIQIVVGGGFQPNIIGMRTGGDIYIGGTQNAPFVNVGNDQSKILANIPLDSDSKIKS